MPEWQAPLDEWIRAHRGVIDAHRLAVIGVSPRTITRMVQRNELIPIFPGVFCSRQWPISDLQRMIAVCLRNEGALIGLSTAGREWGMRRLVDRDLHVLIHHSRSPELAGVVVHRCRRIDPVDIVERPDGLRLTSPPRTLFDLADQVGLDVAASITEQLLNDGVCTLGTITDTFVRLGHPNRPGTRTMSRVLASRPGWSRAVQSDLEMRVLGEIRRQGLPLPQPQCMLRMPSGQPIHVDFGWPEFRVALEVDHPAWHVGDRPGQRDNRRDRGATLAGWLVTRISRFEAESALVGAIAEVGAILRQRGWTP